MKKPPVIVLGAARSGTTLLTKYVLAQHPQLAYWGEPDHVWNHGNAYKSGDVLTAADATPTVKSYIRTRFAEYVEKKGANRILVKSPADTLRVPFIREVFPECQIVHLLRDGRDVALSAQTEWQGKAGGALDSRERRQASFPVRLWKTATAMMRLSERVESARDLFELPAYTVRFVDFLIRMCTGSSQVPWGPRFPGIRFVRRRYSLLETCAIQWAVSVSMAKSGCAGLPADRYREVKYEAFIRDPEAHIESILSFLDLPVSEDLLEGMSSIVESRQLPKWPSRIDETQQRQIESIAGFLLRNLGYPATEADRSHSYNYR